MTSESAVEFDTATRVHIGLDVTDRDRSVAFYRVLLGARPAKVRPGYAKFEVAEPPLNLSLIEGGGSSPRSRSDGSLHYGIQVKSSEEVRRMATRLKQASLPARIEETQACCYAVQTKVWTSDPDGNRWEVFVVLADADRMDSDASACCSPDEATASCG